MARTSLVPQQPVFLSEADNKQLAEMDRQREAFNAAVEKYNQGMMGPGGYNEQLNAYIARLKEIEASGEEVPLPTAPTKMDVPVAPFTEESFVQAQEAAQARAQEAAGQRALAIQAFEDPSRFNLAGFAGLGSRTFAKGGEVKEEGTKASRMMKELGLSKPPKEKTLADEPSKQTPESLAYSLRAQAEGNRDKDLRRGSFSVPGALNVKRFEAGGEARSGEGFSPIAGSMGMPGAPEHERMRADTLGFIKRMDDASVMATASRMTGMPFDTPTQARLMLEQLLGGGVSVSAGVMGVGQGMPERVVGYDVGAKFPALGGQMSVGAMVPRGAGKPSFNVGYRKEFKDGGDVSSEASESRSYLDELEARDDPIRSGRPLSRKGRAKGTQESNEAMSQAVLQGMANMPYNIAGIPGDLANLLAAPTGSQPFYGSESAKALATQLGIRPAPPTDPAAAALYGAADIGSSLINPAGPVRAAARGAERAGAALSGAAKDFQEYNRMLDVPGASYAVRPEGSQLVIRRDDNPDWIGQLLKEGVQSANRTLDWGGLDMQASARKELMENFWNNKAANYFAKQFGTESDPIYRGIRDQYIKSPRLAKDFPDYVLDQLSVGKTRVDAATGQSRFFPKYPAAYDAMRAKYDELTQIRGAVPARDPSQVMSPDYTYSPSRQGTELLDELKNREIDRMIEQGTPVSQADPSLEFLTRAVKNPDIILGPYNAKSILQDYEKATGTRLGNPNFQGVPEPEALPQNLRTAFDKGEIMYGTSGPDAPLRQLFDTNSINEYLNTLSDRELKNVRFEDAVKGGAKVSAKRQERETLAADIRAGKRVPDRIFSEGVSAPLLQFNEGPLAGFAWKRIEKAEATVPEGAYLGHSVGGYAEGGAYGPGKHRDFNEGRSQVYTLRDNRNRPVTTVEVSMRDIGPIVTQIKGNGRATGNTAPVKYDEAVLQFFKDYLKPVRIAESEDYLTPLLKQYKQQFVANMKDGGEVTTNDAFIAKHQAGGPVSKGRRPVREASPRAPQLDSEYTFGSEDAFEFTPAGTRNRLTRFIKSSAGDASNPAAKSFSDPQITRSREEFDRLAKSSKQPPMPSGVGGMFDAFVGPRGAIFVSPLGGPATYTHEMTHAADYNIGKLYRQASAAKEQKSNPAAQQFVDAYEKLVGGKERFSPHESRKKGAETFDAKWVEENKDYRSHTPELAAFAMENAMGGDRGQLTLQRGPLHLDPTLATEFTILTDLAQKYVDSRTNKPR